MLACLLSVLAASIGLRPLAAANAAENSNVSQPSKDRFFFNDDGDRFAGGSYKGPFHIRRLYDPVDVLMGTPVTTLVCCVGADMTYYPSKVRAGYGWRKTRFDKIAGNWFALRYRFAHHVRKHNIDPIQIIKDRATEQGIEFVPSLRMNDGHYGQKELATVHPLTSKFWMENQDLAIQPGSKTFPTCLLDFTHEQVREYRLEQIKEIIERYASDGIELDFTRSHYYFPSGKEKPDLLTDIVRTTRRWLDEKSKRVGKPLILIVRVRMPYRGSTATAPRAVDVVTWIKEGLVDYVVPSSPDRYFTFDLPIDALIVATKGTRCRVVASPESWKATASMYRAGMSNYYAMGQKDVYLFNFFTARAEQRDYYPYRDEDYALLRDLKSPVTLWGRPKHFMAGGFIRGRKVKLAEAGRNYDISIFIGEDLAACRDANILKHARLQVAIDGLHSTDEIEIAMNGRSLPLEEANREGSSISFDLNHALPKVGSNTVTVRVRNFTNAATDSCPEVTRVELLTEYDLLGVVSE